ncbi:PH domain-containing protein [Veronia nyctiphanis]|nr:PH domain-containing protein [Veronia nyctiphanis]
MTNPSILEPEATSNSVGWRRLSPIALLYVLVNILKFAASNILYLLPALVVGWNTVIEYPHYLALAALLMLTLVSVYSVLTFRAYRYRVHQGHVEIRSGVLQKTALDLPYERIQNVRIVQPIYYRFTGHVCVELDTAGSSDQEAKLYALSKSYAEDLKAEILQKVALGADINVDAESTFADHSGEVIINQRSLFDLVLHGISSNRVWIMLGALSPFTDEIIDYLEAASSYLDLDLIAMLDPTKSSLVTVVVFFLSLALTVFLVLVSLSILGAIITFYGFTLSRDDERYIRRSGLLTKHEVTIKLSRLQQIVLKRDWLDMLLGRVNVKLLQSGSTNNSETAQSKNLLVPSVTPKEAFELSTDAWPENRLSGITYKRIGKGYMVSRLSMFSAVLSLISLLGFTLNNSNVAIFCLITLPLLALAIFIRWWRWGYAHDEQYLYVRKGFLGVDQCIVPLYKLQQTRWSQTVWQKSANVGQLKIVLASGRQTVPFVDKTEGIKILDDALHRVEDLKPNWM